MAIANGLPQQPALPPSSTTILVTGATGFLASHIVSEALNLGYTVRGTARTSEKAEKSKEIYGNHSKYFAVVVPDFAIASTEIDEAVKGVDSIVHVASDVSFSSDANKVIPAVVQITLNVLRAAAKEPKVKRFTLTSSSAAVIGQIFGGTPENTVTAESWNDVSVEKAWRTPGPEGWPADQGVHVYSASKVEGEKALWKFVKEEKPAFVANAILPNFNFGRTLPGQSLGGSASFIPGVYRNNQLPPFPASKSEILWFLTWMLTNSVHYINVADTAKLHLAAAVLDDSLENKRIFAFADQFNWNDVVDSIGRVRPDLKLTVQKDPGLGRDLTKSPKEVGANLLAKWFGQDGYKSLDESVKENLEGIA